jgi:hypothetical protein
MNIKFSKTGRAPLLNFIPGLPKYLGEFIGNTHREITVFVKFKSNCRYNGSSTDEPNILFGYTLGKGCKVYIGWKYVTVTDRVEMNLVTISPTCTFRGFLGSFILDKGYTLSLDINTITRTITARYTRVLDKFISGESSTNGILGVAPLGWSFGISPKLCIKNKPEKEMNIILERIS